MNLSIIKAEYGANDTFIDITDKLKQNFVKNNFNYNSCSLYIKYK